MTFDDEQSYAEHYQKVLAPISSAEPAGEDLRTSANPYWQQIKNARQGDREGNLRPEGADVHAADWDTVERLAILSLEKYTKDLQLAVWLSQALTQTDGLAGVAQSLFLVRELSEGYWNCGLYPNFDQSGEDLPPAYWEDGDRAALLFWFDQELAYWINLLPFTPEINGKAYSLAEYYSAVTNLRMMESRYNYWSDRASVQEIEYEFHRALNSAPPQFFQASLKAIEFARTELDRLAACLEGLDTPVPFNRTRDAMKTWEDAIPRWALRDGELPADPPAPVPLKGSRPVDELETRWQQALELVRSQRFDQAVGQIESVFAAAVCERERFLRKTEFAAVLFEVKRYDLAIQILQGLTKQIDLFQLQTWEPASFSVRVWKLLYDCYQCSGQDADKARDLEARLIRVAPWVTLR